MITSRSRRDDPPFVTTFGNGVHDGRGDVPADKGGGGAGFRPHELLEAALATCVAMTVRMAAAARAIPLDEVSVRVRLDRADPARAVFDYDVSLRGALDAKQRRILLAAASACPVRQTLSRRIAFAGTPAVP